MQLTFSCCGYRSCVVGKSKGNTPAMIEAVSPTNHVRRAYDFFGASGIYAAVAVPLERKPRMLALERANIQPTDRVLEVAVGPGATLLEILKHVDRRNVVYGTDLSPKMLEKTRRLVMGTGYSNIHLQEADARHLPFENARFDVLYNSYMLDLIPLADMRVVLAEFRRVLRPGGRLVLVNLSKQDADRRTLYEKLYTWTPRPFVPYVFGGCRPVLMENLVKEIGFVQVERDFMRHILPSEIVTARTPTI